MPKRAVVVGAASASRDKDKDAMGLEVVWILEWGERWSAIREGKYQFVDVD